jgi:hypothetical protein
MPLINFWPVSDTYVPSTLPTFWICPFDEIDRFGAWMVAAMLPTGVGGSIVPPVLVGQDYKPISNKGTMQARPPHTRSMLARHPLTVIHLNGPINSGKTTIGVALAQRLPDARFIDGDDHDAPDDAPFDVQWAIALARIVDHIATARERHLVIAYPIGDAEFARLRAACDARGARLFVATLAPPEAVASSDRGERVLTEWERRRIAAMYREGYASRAFSDCFVDTSKGSADACAQQIAERVATFRA